MFPMTATLNILSGRHWQNSRNLSTVLTDSLSRALIFHLALFYQKMKRLLFFGCTAIQQFNLD